MVCCRGDEMDADRFLTAKEVAREFGEFFSESRLRQWRHRGGGAPYRKLGKRCIYSAAQFQTWLDAHAQTATREAPGDGCDLTDNAGR